MKRIFFVGAMGCVLLAGVPPAMCCDGESPESVLECYSAAYAERDIGAIEALYADDYMWVDVVPLRVHVWDRATAVESAKNIFEHPGTPSVSLTLDGPLEVVAEDAGETWRIEGVEMSLAIVFPGTAESDTAQGCATFYVRQVDGKPGAFEIYREVTFGDAGCARWRECLRLE